MGLPAHKFFLDLNVARFFQLAHVRGEIAPRQPGLAHQEGKVPAFDHVQEGQDHEPGRLVDDAVDIRDGLQVSSASLSGCHRPPRQWMGLVPAPGSRAGNG